MTTILKFFAPSCAPCKALSEKLFQLGVKTQDVNITEDSSSILLQTYGVRKVPTLVKIEAGKDAKILVGFDSQEKLKEFLAS